MLDIIKKNISKYIQLSKEEFNYFTSLLETKKLRKKQFLLEEGDVCRFECFVIAFQNSYVALQRRILANISQTAEERYLHFSTSYPEIEQKVPQHQVAS